MGGTSPAMTIELEALPARRSLIPILFPNAQPCKNLSKHVFNADTPDYEIHCRGRAPEILGDQFRLRRSGLERRSQRLARVLKPMPMSFKRQQSRLVRRHALFR